jgi:hypothetical protein
MLMLTSATEWLTCYQNALTDWTQPGEEDHTMLNPTTTTTARIASTYQGTEDLQHQELNQAGTLLGVALLSLKATIFYG